MLANSMVVDVVSDAYSIAENYLKRSGQIETHVKIHQWLLDAVIKEYNAGTINKIKLANRAITRFERVRGIRAAKRYGPWRVTIPKLSKRLCRFLS